VFTRLDPLQRLLGLLAVGLLSLGLYLSLVQAPPDYYQGEIARIMNIHVPFAKVSLLAYLVAFLCSVAYLWKRSRAADYLAHASVSVGIVFVLATIAAGAIWGKPTWNTWWTWDARLVSFAILGLIMAGYLMLRAYLEDPEKRARYAAVLAIIGFVDLPIIHLSVRWWRTLHQPASLSPQGLSIAPEMMVALSVMLAGMVVLFVYLTIVTARGLYLRDELEASRIQRICEARL
jgi:heme exporter protein C